MLSDGNEFHSKGEWKDSRTSYRNFKKSPNLTLIREGHVVCKRLYRLQQPLYSKHRLCQSSDCLLIYIQFIQEEARYQKEMLHRSRGLDEMIIDRNWSDCRVKRERGFHHRKAVQIQDYDYRVLYHTEQPKKNPQSFGLPLINYRRSTNF